VERSACNCPPGWPCTVTGADRPVAAKAKTADKNREQIRDLYKAELRARGLETPPDEILDAEVDAITGDYRSIARLIGQVLNDVPKFIREIFRPFDPPSEQGPRPS
jgi:hypothetical protein